MIFWRDGKAGYVGGLKHKIKGFFQFRYTVTSEDPVPAIGDIIIYAQEKPIKVHSYEKTNKVDVVVNPIKVDNG